MYRQRKRTRPYRLSGTCRTRLVVQTERGHSLTSTFLEEIGRDLWDARVPFRRAVEREPRPVARHLGHDRVYRQRKRMRPGVQADKEDTTGCPGRTWPRTHWYRRDETRDTTLGMRASHSGAPSSAKPDQSRGTLYHLLTFQRVALQK